MLIDAYAEDWLNRPRQRSSELRDSQKIYLLVDGAFIPGLHRRLHEKQKAILFESLPGCTEEARDASPFLTSAAFDDRNLTRALRYCNRWPMVSVIETTESLAQLADRLSAWCVVEAGNQKFNFRFSDTRRLPAIFEVLSRAQRTEMVGPATAWSFIDRDGRWRHLETEARDAAIATRPVLDERQFALLVNDSMADEMLMLLVDQGMEVYRHPSRSHELLTIALRTARVAQLQDESLLGWCAWFWNRDQLPDEPSAASILQAWQKDFLKED